MRTIYSEPLMLALNNLLKAYEGVGHVETIGVIKSIIALVNRSKTAEPKVEFSEWSDKPVCRYGGTDGIGQPVWIGAPAYECKKCGGKIQAKSKFCPHCGRRMKNY